MAKQEIMIFDDKEDDFWRKRLGKTAELAGWETTVFDNSDEALNFIRTLEEGQLGALLSVLGADSGTFFARLQQQFQGARIIDQASMLGVPICLFSGHPKAAELIRPATANLQLSPTQHPDDVSLAMGTWLTSLAQ